MRLVSWVSLLTVAVFGAALGGACGSTSSNKGGGSNDSSDSGSTNDTSSSNGSGGESSSSSGSGGDASTSAGSGGDASTSANNQSSGGSGGTGGGSSNGPATAECGGMTCEGLHFGIGGIEDADACCPDGADEPVCGLNTSPLEQYDFTIPSECQPKNSPGELDESCPVSPAIAPMPGITFDFPGCCLPSGKCGFMLDTIAQLIPLELGCVDATMFFEDLDDPPDCTPMQGEGGAAN